MLAQLERTLISQRIKEALNRIKAEGKKLGRQKGAWIKRNRLEGKIQEINSLIQQGISRTKIAEKYQISTRTLYSFLKEKQ